MVENFTSKKILLTGGSGFLGSFVSEELIARGVEKKNIKIPRSRELDLRKWEN
ncbi:MAG: GDP-L-fucose synthase, partial [Candidatus Dadabacteria bacterium]